MLELLPVDPRSELVTEIEALFGRGKATRLEIAGVPDLEVAASRCRVRTPACAFVPSALLALDGRSNSLVLRYLRRAAQDPALLLDLDKFVLESHLRLLIDELGMGNDLALVDVHYETLASRHGGDVYVALLEEIPEDLRAVLGFNLRGIPPGVYAPKVARLISALRPFSRLQAIEVDVRRPELPDLPTIRAPMVTVPYEALAEQESVCGERLRTLLVRAHACKARVLLRRVPRGWGAAVRDRYAVDFTCIA